MNTSYNKRDFLKTGLLGLAGCACGTSLLGDNRGLSIPLADTGPVPAKHIREAMHWVETARGIKCELCPNECHLKPNERGLCRTRMEKNGKLVTTGYGNPCAVHVDPIEKKPLNHFYPATKAFSIAVSGCNLSCLNCQNWEISQSQPDKTRNVDLMPAQVVQQAINYNCLSIAYTYS